MQVSAFHRLISRRMWFLLFNVGTTVYMLLSGHLRGRVDSILAFIVALGVMNGIAWVSARNFPDWK